MYSLPSLSNVNWYTMYDRYETNTAVPTNYFLVVNADELKNKIFYKEKVNIIPGQAYRMSVDIAKVNTIGSNPNVSFIINSDETQLTNTNIIPDYSTEELKQGGQWFNYKFDYVPGCDAGNTTFVAFRNEMAGGNGNDLALDNLSMKAIIPQVKAVEAKCDSISFVMLDDAVGNAFPSDKYEFLWQKQGANSVFADITGATSIQLPVKDEGTYRLSVYTSTTEECRMYSNAIVIERNNGSCLSIARPIAVNDTVNLIFAPIFTGNVLDNDMTSNPGTISHDNLSVINFTVQGVTYPAGVSVNVYRNQYEKDGVITVMADGSFTYEAVRGTFGRVPDIEYTVSQKDAGTATAKIIINYISYEVNLDASCTSCPIKLDVISTFNELANSYSVRDDNDGSLVAQGVIIGDTIRFSFRESRSGTIYYRFRADNNDLLTFPVVIAPAAATWAPNLIVQSQEWDLQLNWMTESGRGFPIWCTDVTIPANVPYYPMLSAEDITDTYHCRDITFKDSASVGNIHKLSYRRAFVEFTPERLSWAMLNAPLKYIYSADFQADPTWGNKAGINPPIYMRYFDVKYSADTLTSIPNPDGTKGVSVGNFSKSFADLKERLDLTKGFVLKVDQGSNNMFNGTFKFPRLNADSTEVLFKYHYLSTGNWIENTDTNVSSKYHPFYFTDAGQPGRGADEMPSDSLWVVYNNSATNPYQPRGKDNRYRFIYENSSSPNRVVPFTIEVNDAGTTNIVGNPFMSHLDFEVFSRMNEDNMQPYYRRWDGTTFHSYMNGQADNGTWRGLPGIGTSPVVVSSRYIEPMHSFFVEMKDGKTELLFNPDSISVVPPVDTVAIERTRSQRANVEVSNILKIHLNMGNLQNIAAVGVLPLASDAYLPAEDVYKLFSYDTSYPEIYTIADNQAMDINAVGTVGKEKVIPIGIKTTKTGDLRIDVDGVDNFDAYPYIYITDVEQNKRYDLKKESSLVFNKKEGEKMEGRLYLVLRSDDSWAGLEEVDSENSIDILVDKQLITVNSPMYEIDNIELYDISGRLFYQVNGVNSLSHSFDSGVGSGVFILKVKTTSAQKTFKIKI